jgi:8-oxo-dGTP pyrophosphatase MutT (NUDIX family)
MAEHFKTPSAIVLLLIKTINGKKYVLLQRRANTGFADGLWDFSCSGHVEHGESMTVAAVREVKEELGVTIQPTDLQFLTMVHKRDKSCDVTYYNGYFACENFVGEPTICEPHKCSELGWFPLDRLPADLIPDRLAALTAYLHHIPYQELGW